MKPRKPLRRTSTARSRQLREYRKVKSEFLDVHFACFRCKTFVPRPDRQNHHYFGRIHGLLTYVPGFRMVCAECHTWIENHRLLSIELGFRAPENLFNSPSKVLTAQAGCA